MGVEVHPEQEIIRCLRDEIERYRTSLYAAVAAIIVLGALLILCVLKIAERWPA